MDIDTDVIEDASYEVIHEELIEPYTTNYEGEVTLISKHQVTKNLTEYITNYAQSGTTFTDYIRVVPGTTISSEESWQRITQYDENKVEVASISYGKSGTLDSNCHYITVGIYAGMEETMLFTFTPYDFYTPNIIPSSANGSLIFNMYSNNTTQPTSTSPYMWDLTGLKLEDFYTYGMNNWVKASDDSYMTVDTTPRYKIVGFRYDKVNGDNLALTILNNFISISPILIPSDVTSITVTTSDSSKVGYFWSTDYSSATNTFTTASWDALYKDSGTTWSMQEEKRVFMLSIQSLTTEWFEIAMDNGITIRYHLDDMQDLTTSVSNILISTSVFYWDSMNISHKFNGATSITMPQRMPGYSVRLVNADITPNEYPTMLYPKWIDVTLPITGKLDYTKYNGTSLAWAYAYTTGDVDISPLDSRSQGNITQDYNKLYGTDFVDIVDVWVYKDTDVSGFSTNEAITEAYIELTSDNYTTRIDEVLAYYPNCTDLYLFDDNSVTTLADMGDTNAVYYRTQIKKVTFMDGYFNNLLLLNKAFRLGIIEEIYNIPNSVTSLFYCFYGCTKLAHISNFPTALENIESMCFNCQSLETIPQIPNGIINVISAFASCQKLNCEIDLSEATSMGAGGLGNTFNGCKSLTTPPILPTNYTGSMQGCFQGCTSLTQAPAIPNGVTNMNNTFNGCTSLTEAPEIPEGVTNMTSCFQGCTSLTTAPNIPSSCYNISSAFHSCAFTNITIPIATIGINPNNGENFNTYYSNVLYNCTKLTDITWEGERSVDFTLTNLASNISYTQADIQELVPEHLDDLHKDEIKISFSNKKITINNTETTWE